MSETPHDNMKSTHCRDVGALSHRQGMQLLYQWYETYSNRTWPFRQANCTPLNPGHRNVKSYLFLPNHRRKRRNFAHVDLRSTTFSFPSCIAVDNSGRRFHDLSRNHAGHQPACPELCAKPVGMWNRQETGFPFLPKQWFKHNVLTC